MKPIMVLIATLVLATPALAQTPPPSSMRTIEVTGQGEAHAAPDLATLEVAVETHAQTAAQATAQNAQLSERITRALTDRLAGLGRVQTGTYSLYPDYGRPQGTEEGKIIGYRATNSIIVETGALKETGPLIDIAIKSGADRVNALNFSLRNDTDARGAAIRSAADDAIAQAKALAASLGVSLKRVVRASTTVEVRPVPVMMERARAMMASVETPIAPGQITVPANITLTYEIQ